MTSAQVRGRSPADTSGTNSGTTVLDLVVHAINDPRSQTPEVAEAMAVLSAAAQRGTGTAAMLASWSPSSTEATSRRFDGVVTLLTEVIRDLDVVETSDYLISEALPHFVPEGWSEFLRTPVAEDPDFELPWLGDLDDS